MNKQFKKQFAYDWIYYLLVLVLSIVVWNYAFKLHHSYKSEETIVLFFEGKINDYDFENIAASQLKNEGLNKLEISSASSSDVTFNDKYNLIGLNNSDIVLISKTIAEKTACSLTFAVLNDNYGLEYFVQENTNYGIIINDSIKDNLSKYFNFNDDEYVLMINESSIKSSEKNNLSFSFVEWMVSYEK